MIPILILAAGQSSRMRGADKLLEQIDGEPLIAKQARQALTLGGEVFVAMAPGQTERLEALNGIQVTPLLIPEAAEGIGGTMREAVARLPQCPAFMMVLGDLVAITPADFQAVYDGYLENPDQLIWRGATESGEAGHPIVFSADLRPKFAQLSGDTGGENLVRPLKGKTMLVPLEGNRARMDLDTPEDWAAWRALNR